MKYRNVITLFFIFIVFIICNENGFSQKKKIAGYSAVFSSDEFVKRILQFSSEQKQIDLQRKIAANVHRFSYYKLFVPSFDLEIYPFGYDKSQLTANEILQRNFIGTNVKNSKAFYNFGVGLKFAIPTPFGGYFKTHLSNILFMEEKLQDYKQQIKFGFTLTQPLFFNNKLAETGWFSNEKTISDRKYSLEHIKATINQNMLIRRSYEQAYGLITLQKQKALLEYTIAVLKNDYKAMRIRKKNGVISSAVLLSFKITLDKKEQQYKKVKAEYENVCRVASNMLKINSSKIYIKDKDNDSKWKKYVLNHMPVIDKLENNLQIRKTTIEYLIKERSSYLENIKDGPVINFDFSLQPQYPMKFVERNFINSYTDLFSDRSVLDLKFTVSILIPLLSSLEKKARQSMNSLVLSMYKERYEDTLDKVIQKIQKMYADKAVREEKLKNLLLDITLQKAFLNEKKIQLSKGSTSKQEVKRQYIQVQNSELQYWIEKSKYLLLLIDILSNTGYNLTDIIYEEEK